MATDMNVESEPSGRGSVGADSPGPSTTLALTPRQSPSKSPVKGQKARNRKRKDTKQPGGGTVGSDATTISAAELEGKLTLLVNE